MEKVLYFEGAGCVPRGEVENCRIRTAFHDDEGRTIYLEICGVEVTKYSSSRVKLFNNAGFVDSCRYILGDDDENKHIIHHRNEKVFEYTKAEILKFVNSLGCSFDKVVILPFLAGYRVFKEDGHNFGDEFEHDLELTAKREEIYKHFYNVEKSEGKKYPNFSLWVDADDKHLLHLLRHFPGYNKHWSIRTDTDDWEKSVTETKLGKFAC